MSERVCALKPLQLRAQVLGLLPREPRDVLLAQELRAVALAAVELLGEPADRPRHSRACVLCFGGAAFCAEK